MLIPLLLLLAYQPHTPPTPTPTPHPTATPTRPATVLRVAPVGQHPPDQLSAREMTVLESLAPYYRRFPDGSLWSRKVEADGQQLPQSAPSRAAYAMPRAPLWYCSSTGEAAASESAVFDLLDQRDLKAQAAAVGGTIVPELKVFHAVGGGLLVVAKGKPALLSNYTPPSDSAEGSSIGPVVVRVTGSFSYETKGAGQVTLPKWEYVEVSPTRLAHESVSVTVDELVAACKDGTIPGLVEWTPKQVAPLGHEHEAGVPKWEWVSKLTRITPNGDGTQKASPPK